MLLPYFKIQYTKIIKFKFRSLFIIQIIILRKNKYNYIGNNRHVAYEIILLQNKLFVFQIRFWRLNDASRKHVVQYYNEILERIRRENEECRRISEK